jgi:hypothetical protein
MQNENGPLEGAVIHLVAGAGLACVDRVRRPRHEPASLRDSQVQNLSINQHKTGRSLTPLWFTAYLRDISVSALNPCPNGLGPGSDPVRARPHGRGHMPSL